jgi:hypothetical protein
MQATNFEAANQTLQPPPSMDGDDVGVLPIMVGRHDLPSGEQALCLVSCWEPTKEERNAIANGANIYLHLLTQQMPPALLSTTTLASPVQVRPTEGDGAPPEGEDEPPELDQ